jgi:hypothetical protein
MLPDFRDPDADTLPSGCIVPNSSALQAVKCGAPLLGTRQRRLPSRGASLAAPPHATSHPTHNAITPWRMGGTYHSAL